MIYFEYGGNKMSHIDESPTNSSSSTSSSSTQDKPLDKPLVPDPPPPAGTNNNIIHTHGASDINTKTITFLIEKSKK